MTYGYIRVSTDKQTVENQKIAIKKYCEENKIKKIKFISETKSGTVKIEKRLLGELLKNLQKGDVLIVTEISRLGRSINMIFNIINALIEKEIKLVAIKNNFVLAKNDLVSKVLIFAFGLSAEVERELISERTKLGLERARKNGKTLGRKKGFKVKKNYSEKAK